MKEWLRILPFFLLIFGVLTYLDFATQPDNIRWILNFSQALALTAIGCVGQYLIHKNVLQDSGDDDNDGSGCIGCGKPE